MRGSLLRCSGAGFIILLLPLAVLAEPSRVIILRHAEKLNHRELCDLGEQRAQALAGQFLGRGAAQSLFAGGQKPDAFLAITPHTIETVTPAAQSWNLPVTAYKAPTGKDNEEAKESELNRLTQEAANDVLTDPRYAGKTVVMAWEHNRIAKAKLEQENPGEEVTLRQLLRLDRLADAPKTWPDSNYDFFWIVDYEAGNPVPTAFHMVRQAFTAPFDTLPANGWDEPEPEHIAAGCKK